MVPNVTLTNGGLEAVGPDDYGVVYSLYSNSPVDFVEALPSEPHITPASLWCALVSCSSIVILDCNDQFRFCSHPPNRPPVDIAAWSPKA